MDESRTQRMMAWARYAGVGFAALTCVQAGGCILEANPDYQMVHANGNMGPGVVLDGGTATGMETGADTDTSGEDTGPPMPQADPDPVEQGCSEADCVELHVGLSADGCPREGTNTCDHVGPLGIRDAAAEASELGGANILVHDADGAPARYVGSIDVPGNTTLGAAFPIGAAGVIVEWEPDDPGILRLLGDDVHLHDLTLLCPELCQNAVIARADPQVPQSVTGGHMIERLALGAAHPELFGVNGANQPFVVGGDTIVRHNHVWGYWDGTIALAAVSGTQLYNNTFIWYETPDIAFDVSDADSVSIVNNVFVNLGLEIPTLIDRSGDTQALVVSGNVVEGFGELVDEAGGGAGNIVEGDVGGPAPLLSPRQPRPLADADVPADLAVGSALGVSLDGVALRLADEMDDEVLAGAYQRRSGRSLPRPTVIRLGSDARACGDDPCDAVQSDGDSMQEAVWWTWPGAELQVFPGQYSGASITWPITIRGMGLGPEEVVVRPQTDGVLAELGFMQRNETVLRIIPHSADPVSVEGLTLMVDEGMHGVYVEGELGTSPTTPHELSRLQVLSTAEDEGAGLSASGLHLGDNVYAHDILIRGGFETCVRTGPREDTSDPTPDTTTVIHNVTCRLTRTDPDDGQLAAFEVAGAVESVWANIVVEMAGGGPLLRAQRRTGGGGPGQPPADTALQALDAPTSFVAQSWLIQRPGGGQVEGFFGGAPEYSLVALDPSPEDAPLFVSEFDARLVEAGVDAGIAPEDLSPVASAGISLDGVSREGRAIDLGCFEQGE